VGSTEEGSDRIAVALAVVKPWGRASWSKKERSTT
jgi:hypothetical protein